MKDSLLDILIPRQNPGLLNFTFTLLKSYEAINVNVSCTLMFQRNELSQVTSNSNKNLNQINEKKSLIITKY